MKFLRCFLVPLIIALTFLTSIEAQDQSGFISLDCGLVPKNTIYTEKATNITFKSDADYIDSGVVGKINEVYRTSFKQQTWSLRSFPEGQRNCYNFNLTANSRYLIRGTFNYGNYDGLNRLPSFDLHIGPNKWTSVSILEVTNSSSYGMIHLLTQDRLQVCLVKTGETTPFISSLELRPLNDETYVPKNESYVTENVSLIELARVYFSPTPEFIRYDEDIHDRIWVPYTDKIMSTLTADVSVATNNIYNVPQLVTKTAGVPANASQPLTLSWPLGEITAKSYIYMHFAEIQNLEANETREFNVSYNGDESWFSDLRPSKSEVLTLYNLVDVGPPDGILSFTLTMTHKSTLPPLINGLEIYRVLDLPQLETDQHEVNAMVNIKTTYDLKNMASWQGDPCVPQLYRWEGLNCSYPDSDSPRIISLNLSGSNLTGTITSNMSKLKQLTVLDLSNNDLSGNIPAFLADMKLLNFIDLSGNPKLNISVPKSLQRKIDEKSLRLIVGETDKKRSKSNHVVAIAASVAGVLTLLVILAIVFVTTRKKQKTAKASGATSIITTDRKFTYSQVLKMTNNFERVLGKGGFGSVYYGNLNNTPVAVKMLSHSSAQGYKEFKAEVELLLRVHYRHLVTLVGYCDDRDNLALIYEYMANGDLSENMSGKHGGNFLSWETRIQIAVEAAQGLDYLHNGCTPPMVHRDVKPTNILLNERSQAKLADFGLSRSFPFDGESYVMTVIAGTPGYLDPEYYTTNWLSEKSDVYSFGVVLLEIVTNQPVIDQIRDKPHINDWVRFMLTKGDIRNIVDPKLMENYDTNSLSKVVELALACVNPSSSGRPTMQHIVMNLNECLAFEIERKEGSQKTQKMDFVELSQPSISCISPTARLIESH